MMTGMTLSLPVEAEANELLSRNPLALVIGMLLDQQGERVTGEQLVGLGFDGQR